MKSQKVRKNVLSKNNRRKKQVPREKDLLDELDHCLEAGKLSRRKKKGIKSRRGKNHTRGKEFDKKVSKLSKKFEKLLKKNLGRQEPQEPQDLKQETESQASSKIFHLKKKSSGQEEMSPRSSVTKNLKFDQNILHQPEDQLPDTVEKNKRQIEFLVSKVDHLDKTVDRLEKYMHDSFFNLQNLLNSHFNKKSKKNKVKGTQKGRKRTAPPPF